MSNGRDHDRNDNDSNHNIGEGDNSCSVKMSRTLSSSSHSSEVTVKLPDDREKPTAFSEVSKVEENNDHDIHINNDDDDDDADANKPLVNNSKDGKIKVEEKLQKLVYILQSSEDRDEKLETLRLITELAESLPDIRAGLDETVLADISIDDIPLPSYPPLESIPIPSETSSTSALTKEGNAQKTERLYEGIFKPQRRELQGEDTAVTKTRLGVVTLHKNKSSTRFSMTRSSLLELMPIEKLREAQEKLSKMKMAKLAKKKMVSEGDHHHSEKDSDIAGGKTSTVGEVGVSSRKLEIQQRINAWKEELLRDASRNTKRKKLTLPFETEDISSAKGGTSSTAGSLTTDAKLQTSNTVMQKLDAKNVIDSLKKTNYSSGTLSESSVKHTTNDVAGLLNRFSISVTDKEGKKSYLWPIEMIKKTKTMPPLAYSCNPLYYDFPLQQSSSASLGKIKKGSKTLTGGKVKDVGDVPSSPKKLSEVGDSVVEAKKVYNMLESRTSATSYSAVPPTRNESSNFDDDVEESGAAKWDTSSDSESEHPVKANLPAVKKSVVDGSSVSTKSKIKNSNVLSHTSSAESERSSNYSSSYRSSESRSRSRSYSSRASRRHRHRRHGRSYRSRSRSYSTDSFSSYSSRGSYSSSRSRSNRRRKRRRYSRSSASRSYSRSRYSHRSSSRSRSRSPYHAKRFKSASQEVKRVISHKILPMQIKKNTSPAPKPVPTAIHVQKPTTETPKASASASSDVKSTVMLASSTANTSTCPATTPALLNIPLPTRSSPPAAPPPFIGPTLPTDHPLSTMRDIPLPQNDLPVEETFQYIGPNDPLVFKNKLQASTSEAASNDSEKKEKDPNASFAIPPEQAERYRALRLQAERHARKVMGSLTMEEEMEEEEEASQVAATFELTTSLTDNGGNPQQQLVEELYLEQMASLMAQQQHQQQQQQQQQQLQQQQIIIGNSQTPVGRLVHIIGGQQNVASAASPQLIPVLQVAPKVVSALPQAGAPVILAPSNAAGHLTAAGGPTLIQLQTDDQAHARARLQQARIELAERTLGDMHATGARQEWVQIVQVPQQQPTGLIFTHPIHQQAHHLGIPFIHRPNLLFRTARKAPTLIQVSGSGQIVSPTFIGAQQMITAQQSPQQTIPVFLGAGGQMLVPRFFR